VALDDVTDTSVTAADKSITVKWTNPEETKTVNGVTATWAKTLVVLKADSAPEDETDGTVYESTTYSEKSHVFTVENGHDYYVAFFVISDLESVKRTDVDGSFATYATLTVTTEETTLIDQIVMVTWTDGDEEKSLTGSFGVMGFAQFKIPYMGAVTVSSTDGSDTAEGMTRIKEWGACSIAIDFSTIKPLSIITPDQLTKVIQGYYAKTITLAQIQSVWSVGDTVEFDIAAMAATGVGESHVAQTQAFVVLDFNHDTLVTATGGKSNALVTWGQVNVLSNGTKAETGYMNSSNTNTGGWDESARRTWCNNVYLKALPAFVQALIKPVKKSNYKVYNDTTLSTTNDSVFLASETEMFGANTYSAGATEGTQYEYFKTAANRIKKSGNASVTGSAQWFWERSPRASAATYFCNVNSSGAAGHYYASIAGGLAPCFSF
jgi:hypothetical protein